MSIEDRFKAAPGKFRVIGVDTFSNTEWMQGDYETEEEAIDVADEKGGSMTMMYVYDDTGRRTHSAGQF